MPQYSTRGWNSKEMKSTCMCTVRKQEEEIRDTLSFRFLAIHNWSRSIINNEQTNFWKKKKKKKKRKEKNSQEILVSRKSVPRSILGFRRFERNVGGKECLTSFIPSEQKFIHETLASKLINCLSLCHRCNWRRNWFTNNASCVVGGMASKAGDTFTNLGTDFLPFSNERMFLWKQKKKKKIFL